MKHQAPTFPIEAGYSYENGGYRCRSTFRPDLRILLPALIVIAAIVWWGVSRASDWYWIVIPSLVVFALGACVSWRFTIEPANGVVREQAFLYGRRILRERLIPFTEFKFVLIHDAGGDEGQNFGVFLQHNSGRRLLVKGCGPTPRPAEELAWRISCDTGIKLKGDPA
jgi:hypothetical protein